MPLNRRERIEIVGDRMQDAALRKSGKGRKARDSRPAQGEPPAPRMRFAAPFPDRARHSRALAERSPPGQSPVSKTGRDDIRHIVRESNDFNLKVTRAVRVQTVNGRRARNAGAAGFPDSAESLGGGAEIGREGACPSAIPAVHSTKL